MSPETPASTPPADAASGTDGRLLDLQSLKALAHPLRTQIIDVLSQYGPATASGLAERLDESSGATSYHLRQLAKHDFVRELEGKGTGRERWWERTPGGIKIDPRAAGGSVAARAAADVIVRQWQDNTNRLLQEFLSLGLDTLPAEWVDASITSSMNARMTADQLAEVNGAVAEVIDAAITKYRNQDVPGARPVQFQFNAFPLIEGQETTA